MKIILQPFFVILLYVLLRSADMSITYGLTKNTQRSLLYGIVAILALVMLIILVFGL